MINIYNDETKECLAWLCDDDMELPSQIEELEKWLFKNAMTLPSGTYVADIGFDIRKDACGGGAVLSVEAMAVMVRVGMALFLSEYPCNE